MHVPQKEYIQTAKLAGNTGEEAKLCVLWWWGGDLQGTGVGVSVYSVTAH